jgi:hypothetical protein
MSGGEPPPPVDAAEAVRTAYAEEVARYDAAHGPATTRWRRFRRWRRLRIIRRRLFHHHIARW